MGMTQTRRLFLATVSLTSAAGLLGARPALAAEAALETTSVRITKNQGICYAPQYVAEEFLRDEGFTDIRFVDVPPPEISAAITQGKVDVGMNYALATIREIDAGAARHGHRRRDGRLRRIIRPRRHSQRRRSERQESRHPGARL